jgi:alanyl-tRNA synthetase
MTSSEIRSRFLEFFQKRGHTVIPSASLVTSDEKGLTNPTLFNTAGMQPLIPYLLGKPYLGADGKEIKRLVNVQKCLRTTDIDDVGDKTHATFFEMLGNWSLGDYFKKEAIEWSYDFLTSKSEASGDRGLGLDPNRLYVTVFEGDQNAPRDDEAVSIWQNVFKGDKRYDVSGAGGDTLKGEPGRIFYMPAENNWWQAGDNGPCGPDTEMFYDVTNRFGGRAITKAEYLDADEKRDVVEVWNDVFMQYEKKDGTIVGNLPKPSIDTGAGLERLAMVMQNKDNIYDTDLFGIDNEQVRKRNGNFPAGIDSVISLLNWYSPDGSINSKRIIADHIRAAVLLISDNITPSSDDRGYVLRKLLRRAIRHSDIIGLSKVGAGGVFNLFNLAQYYIDIYSGIYDSVRQRENIIKEVIHNEDIQFRKTLHDGLKVFEKIVAKIEYYDRPENQISFAINVRRRLSAIEAFDLYQTHGFPIELTLELAKERGVIVDLAGFEAEFKKHQELSRFGAEQKFKGGLADANDPMVVRYHTATHLLHQALHDVLGDGVAQKGSNITPERLRFDFSFGSKMSDEQKKKVEEIVNEKIGQALPVNKVVMSLTEAEKTGARHFFGEKYGNEVSVYFIGNDVQSAYSKEFCGGPHVSNTRELAGPEGKWRFKIMKEEAVAAGVRRIKAVLA